MPEAKKDRRIQRGLARNIGKMAISHSDKDHDLLVNEHEGLVLSNLARSPDMTRYQLYESMRNSPTSSYNTSKGSLYPLVNRMIERGYVEGRLRTGGREAEELRLTERGRQALAKWMFVAGPQQSFSHDPLLHRILSLSDLSREERLQWIASAKAMLLGKRDELNEFHAAAPGDYADIVHGTSVAIVNAKLEWLDRLLIQVVKENSET